ncbi:GTPase HflX [Pontibacillus yanchengensis]|uniref:GTPase HflX n=2 Tax=Pontibacillus yanchengensis TaxID=462910 RepID=A0ACC7VCH2_9BACI|nr:GTPase HflX [Pontibacillus yanchengensis]MYL33234.1 GTPase HflX [Pontibacillus yanchengensis]MYL51916.1 GTPase HflX [Pontibacillus yanchengensis]
MEQHERVLVAACHLPSQDEERFQSSLEELTSLTETAHGVVDKIVIQKRQKIHQAIYMGEGKIEEIKAYIDERGIELVIFNDELTPGQMNNLADHLEVRIIDRTQLILDIFAQRANTKEGKLQVELAQLQYMLPRIYGQGKNLSRLGGGIGTRGPGETKLETDRRHIQRRIDDIKRQIQQVATQRQQYRKRRKENKAYQIAIVGYTNAGKSTLFNRITNNQSFEENQLFATLDPLTRQVQLPSGFQALLSDTVGFIQDLPTTLIAAFRSTLEEVTEADFIVHVVDASHPDHIQHEETVQKHLKELNADHLPMLTVYNKKDLLRDSFIPVTLPAVTISAYDPIDIKRLFDKLEEGLLKEWVPFQTYVPATDGKLLYRLSKHAIVRERDFIEEDELYFVKGFIHPDHPLYHQIQKRH